MNPKVVGNDREYIGSKKKELVHLKVEIVKVLRKYHVNKAGIFGSYARGTMNKSSDVDIIIKPVKNMGFAFAGLELELSQKLKRKVDLVSYDGLSPYLKDEILRQEVRIL